MSFIKTGSPEPILHIIKSSEKLAENAREKLEDLKDKVEKTEKAEKN